MFANSWRRPKDKRRADCSDGAAPVAIHPIAEQTDAKQNQHAAEQRPLRGHPSLQHPGDGHAHRGYAEQHTNPRIAHNLAQRQRHSLCRRIHGRIRRVLEHMERVEENPERVRRIGQPSVGKRVRGKQVAEFVVYFRLRHAHPGQQGQAPKDREAADGGQGGPGIPRQFGKRVLQPREDELAKSRHWQSQSDADRQNEPV